LRAHPWRRYPFVVMGVFLCCVPKKSVERLRMDRWKR